MQHNIITGMIPHYVHRFWTLEKKNSAFYSPPFHLPPNSHFSPMQIYPFCFKIPKDLILLQHLKFEESAKLVGSVEPLKDFKL